MTLKVLPFPEREKGKISPGVQDGALLGIDAAAKASAVVDLGGVRGVYTERLPDSDHVRLFFNLLAQKKVIFIKQQKDGDLLGTDMVYVPGWKEDDQTPDQVTLSVEEFCRYTLPPGETITNFGEYIMRYTATHRYMIEVEDEDASDFDNMEQLSLAEVPDFAPEKIQVVDLDEDNGYEYEVIEVMGEVHIPGKNFIVSEKYRTPLLFLLIDAAHHLGYLAEDTDVIHITKYGSGTTTSLTLMTTYQELLEVIDASIRRAYTLIPEKYDTPEKRRRYIRDKFVVPSIDPDLLGGLIEAPNDDA